MPFSQAVDSRILLTRLRETLAEAGEGQERLNRIVRLIAEGLVAEVCSVYLRRDAVLELCATEGLKPEAVHRTRLRIGQGLVGRIAETAEPLSTRNAPGTPGFRYMPETGEEIFSSFLGVPIQRLGEVLGVLVVQNRGERDYTEDEIYALEVVAMVIAEMAELGAFIGPGPMEIAEQHKRPFFVRGIVGQEGVAEGRVLLHEPHVVVSQPITDDPAEERARLLAAIDRLRAQVDEMLAADYLATKGEHHDVLHAYRMFANDRGWVRRLLASVESGLTAEVAVEKEQSATRARMSRTSDPYLRERLHDLDDLSNRLLRLLDDSEPANGREIPEGSILVARNIGPGELLEYGRKLRGVVLEEGSVGSHAAIVARALAIPLVIQAERITREARNGDLIFVDGDTGTVHLRPDESVARVFREKIEMRAEAQQAYAALRDKPATSRDGVTVTLMMNAGLMADLPSLPRCGAAGVGLFRTELQFLIRSSVPRRGDLAALYGRIYDSALGKPVTFRTLDIGSDKVLPYMRREDEPNPALGWRAIRVGLDRPGILRLQIQALIRGARGRPLYLMFPFVAEAEEFERARDLTFAVLAREQALGHTLPERLELGAMLETPSLAFAPDRFFSAVDFLSIGGNDLKQFFFAADRENERVRRRYDMLSTCFMNFIDHVVARAAGHGTPLSFCGEDAGRPVEAVALAASGLRTLSMRAASIGPVKLMLRSVDLAEARAVMDRARRGGATTLRPALETWLRETGAPL
jgi:phosphotransferase system enzyme I (PtsP)